LFEIKDIKDKDINFKLYDFQVKDVQSYSPMGFIIHNSGKVMTPDAEYNNLSLNENIKAADQYNLPERFLGSIWERVAHMHTPIHSKFLNVRSPLEAYQRSTLYGRNLKMWCINPNEIINTKNGMIKAEDIKIGDEVITLDGNWNTVKDILPKNIKDTGNNNIIYDIKLCGNYRNFKVTGNHEVFVLHTKKCIKKGSKNKQCFGPCNTWCSTKNRLYNNYKNEWDKVSNLESDVDYMVMPIPRYDEKVTKINISSYINMDKKIIKDNKIVSMQYLFGRKVLYKVPCSREIPIEIENSNDFYKLVGWYLAEGYSKIGKSVCFAFHEKEIEYINEVNELMFKIFNIRGKLRKNNQYNDHGVYLEFSSTILSEFFKNYIGHLAENKKIPNELLFTSKKNKIDMLQRYFWGDGHFNGQSLISATTSEILSNQLYLLLLSLEIVSALYFKDKKEGLQFNFKGSKYKYNANKSYWNSLQYFSYCKLYNISIEGEHFSQKKYFIESGYLYSKIENIETKVYGGIVYDFTIDKVQSYCGIGICYHNSHPIDHFAEAYARGFISKTTPFQGSVAGAIAGTLAGGPGLGTALGAGVGGLYGGIHGVYRSITGSTYIPGEIKEARNMNRYFDQVTHTKNMMLYNMTGDNSFLEEAKSTMTGLVPTDNSRASWGNMYRATPPQERPYIMAFISEDDITERANILRHVPEEVGDILKTKWAFRDKVNYSTVLSKQATYPMPSPDWLGWSPSVPIEDVKLKVVERAGLDVHDFGLGFANQMNRVNDSPWLDSVSVDMVNSTRKPALTYNQSISEIKNSIESILRSNGISSTITVAPSSTNNITIYNS